MAYHSSFNEKEAPLICSMSVLPIKSKFKGPAPILTDNAAVDIVDEAVDFFRANILFRNFEVKGGADRLLIYLTLYIHQCLIRCQNKDKDSALKTLNSLAIEKFLIPGDPNFPLGGFVHAPKDGQEADQCRQWFTQLRNETGVRLCESMYAKDATKANKWWICWTKRKFLNKSLEGP